MCQKEKLKKASSSIMANFEEISKLLKIDNKELGIKKNIKNQLDEINVKFDKKPEM